MVRTKKKADTEIFDRDQVAGENQREPGRWQTVPVRRRTVLLPCMAKVTRFSKRLFANSVFLAVGTKFEVEHPNPTDRFFENKCKMGEQLADCAKARVQRPKKDNKSKDCSLNAYDKTVFGARHES